jgi:hypothetical protein
MFLAGVIVTGCFASIHSKIPLDAFQCAHRVFIFIRGVVPKFRRHNGFHLKTSRCNSLFRRIILTA